MLWPRVLLALLTVPAFALVHDSALDQVAGHTYCLSRPAAYHSSALTSQLCFTVPDPRRAGPVR